MKTAIDLSEKLDKISEHWSPKIIAQMNDYHFKLVKFQGEFVGMTTRTPMRCSSCWLER